MFTAIRNTRYLQYVASLSAAMSITSGIMYLTWASPTLPLLRSKNSPIGVTLTIQEASWVASIIALSAVPTIPITTNIVDRIGRKWSLLLTTPFYVFPWIWIIFATSFWELMMARIIGGAALAHSTIVTSIYIAEIADKDIRGRLGISNCFMKLIGSILVLSIGPFVSYSCLAIISAIIPIIFFLIFYFMPESPYHLIRIGRIDEAKRAMKRLSPRNTSPNLINEKLLQINFTIENDMRNKMGFVEFFSGKDYRKLIFIMFGIRTMQQMSGMSAMDSYMQTIIGISGSSVSPHVSSVIFGIVQLPAAIFASLTVDKLGRKPLLLISAFGCAAALITEGTYFFLQDYTKQDINSISWLPTTALTIFLVMGNLGVINLPYILLGELFPTNVKTVAVTSVTTYGGVLAFVSTKMFAPISQTAGTCTIFWIYAGVCVFGFIFVYFFLPETKGKSFREIQEKINEFIEI